LFGTHWTFQPSPDLATSDNQKGIALEIGHEFSWHPVFDMASTLTETARRREGLAETLPMYQDFHRPFGFLSECVSLDVLLAPGILSGHVRQLGGAFAAPGLNRGIEFHQGAEQWLGLRIVLHVMIDPHETYRHVRGHQFCTGKCQMGHDRVSSVSSFQREPVFLFLGKVAKGYCVRYALDITPAQWPLFTQNLYACEQNPHGPLSTLSLPQSDPAPRLWLDGFSHPKSN
jgi:hypothetical protein